MNSDASDDSATAADAERALDAVRLQVDAVARERPLFSAALNAQFQRMAADSPGRYRIPDSTLAALARQMAIPQSLRESMDKIAAEVAGSLGSGGLRESFYFPIFQTLTSAADYREPDPPATAYTGAMTSAGAYFLKDEAVIGSIADLNRGIANLVSKNPDLPLVWRGAKNAYWGIHSALFRHLCNVNGVKLPEDHPKGKQPYPDEDQLVRAEAEILRVARTDWRFDGLSALETFGRIQHAGGPTRLLDVTKNPYIAAWFAVEADISTDDSDARLIAFATRPISKPDKPEPPNGAVELDAEWADRSPTWHAWTDATARQAVDWGTGASRRLWVPPAYDPRILAQNAAFLLDGVPITTSKTAPYFKSPNSPDGGNNYWSRADLLASASIYAKTASPNRKAQYNARNFAPTFTFRIRSTAKSEIRDFLETRFGYTRSYVYPDVSALADHLRSQSLAGPSA